MRATFHDSWDALHELMSDVARDMGRDVAWPGQGFSPSFEDGRLVPYLRVAILPTSTPTHIYQVSAVWPKDVGHLSPMRDLQKVAEQFHADRVLPVADGTRIRISRRPWIAAPIESDGEVTVPLSVQWTSFR